MNLKEYIFYSGKSLTEIAGIIDVTPAYMRALMSGCYPFSKKMARRFESITEGLVKADNILGPPTHPDINKIIDLQNRL